MKQSTFEDRVRRMCAVEEITLGDLVEYCEKTENETPEDVVVGERVLTAERLDENRIGELGRLRGQDVQQLAALHEAVGHHEDRLGKLERGEVTEHGTSTSPSEMLRRLDSLVPRVEAIECRLGRISRGASD